MIIEFKDLKHIRQLHKNEKIVICSGWFDMFHIGHLNFLKKAKEQGNILMVHVRNDIEGKIIKGNSRPIIQENQRLEILDSLKYVDYTILDDNVFTDKPNIDRSELKYQYHWQSYIPVINDLNPNAVFALEETFSHGNIPNYLEENNIKLVICDRTEGVSTTYIENKLKGDK